VGKPSDLIQGTLDLLILKTLAAEPKHGWAIAKRIQQVSDDVLQITQGSLYPALHRLEQQALIAAEWGQTETGREAKFYELTKTGRAALKAETAQWERLSSAVGLVLRNA
jgi:transcriptional regulator